MQLYTHAFKSMNPWAKNGLVALLIGIIIIPTAFVMAETHSDIMPYPADLYAQCFDGKDNDGDGKIDLKDKDCPICHDGLDNDGDGLIDDKDPDCPKNSTGWKSAAAVLGWNSDEGLGTYGGEIPSGGTIGGGSIPTGGSIGSCTRVTNFPRRVRTETGYYYVNDFYCDTGIATGGDLNNYYDENSRIVRVRAGGFIPTGGSIGSNGAIKVLVSIPVGGTIGGGTIPVSNTITSGGTIKTSTTIPTSTITSGGTIGTNTNITTGGSVGGGTIATQNTIPYGGTISTASTIPTQNTLTYGGTIGTNSNIPSGTSVGGGSANAGGRVTSGGTIRTGGYIRSGGSI